MGRIDDALRRSGAKAADDEAAGATSPGVFESPWNFHEELTGDQSVAPVPERLAGVPDRIARPATDLPPTLTRHTPDPLLPADPRLAVFKGFRPDMLDRLVVGTAMSPFMAE